MYILIICIYIEDVLIMYVYILKNEYRLNNWF